MAFSVAPVIYWALVAGQLLLGLYGDAKVCVKAAAERPGSVCEERSLDPP